MPFDICDGRNEYAPCRQCNAETGMGLVARGNGLAVECSFCGHRGPEVEVPDLSDPNWLKDAANRDEAAFKAWNGD